MFIIVVTIPLKSLASKRETSPIYNPILLVHSQKAVQNGKLLNQEIGRILILSFLLPQPNTCNMQ